MRKYLFILICLPLWGQVPNTTTFNFIDVKDEIEDNGGATTNSLTAAFTNANASGFDPAYEGSKNSLLNFRNYTHSPFYDTGDTYSFSSQTTAGRGLFFKPDGTKVFISSTTTIYAYNLSIAWDITSMSYASQSFAAGAMGLTFKPDGTKFYTGYNTEMKEYTMSTAWDITTASLTYTLPITDTEGTDMGVYLHPSGTYIYKLGGNTDNIRRYTMNVAYDLSTVISMQVDNVGVATSGLFLKSDGTKMFTSDYNNTARVFESYDINTAWDITSGLTNNIEVSNATLYRDLYIRSNGQDFYVITQTGIHRWYANTAWEID